MARASLPRLGRSELALSAGNRHPRNASVTADGRGNVLWQDVANWQQNSQRVSVEKWCHTAQRLDGVTRRSEAVRLNYAEIFRVIDRGLRLAFRPTVGRNWSFVARAMAALDRVKTAAFRGNQHVGEASIDASPGKSAATTAATLGVSQAQVERVRAVLASENFAIKAQLHAGQSTINASFAA